MDSITQATLGAAIGETILGKKMGNKGALLGAVVATIPDLDVIFYLFYDSFDMLSIHRGFSHSIVASFLGATLIAYLLQRTLGTSLLSYSRLWLFAWLTLFTHTLLDAFTAYGTQLFLPFSDERVGFDSINVIDPIYTLPLLIGLVFSLFIFRTASNRAFFNSIGLIVSSLYLLFTLANKHSIEQYFEDSFTQANIIYTDLLTMPVGVANIQWYGVAKDDKHIYLQKFSYFQEEFTSISKIPINDAFLDELSPSLKEKMIWFAKGFYTVNKVHNKIRIYNLQVDMRGIVETKEGLAPTMGYFEITKMPKGEFKFSSGVHKK